MLEGKFVNAVPIAGRCGPRLGSAAWTSTSCACSAFIACGIAAMKAWPRCAQGSHLRELCGTLSGALACFALSFRSVTEATVGWEIARWPGVRAQGGRQHDDGSMMGCMLDNEITFLVDHLLGASGGGALCLNVCVVCVCVCRCACLGSHAFPELNLSGVV